MKLYALRSLTLRSSKGFTNIATLLVLSALLIPGIKLADNNQLKQPSQNTISSVSRIADDQDGYQLVQPPTNKNTCDADFWDLDGDFWSCDGDTMKHRWNIIGGGNRSESFNCPGTSICRKVNSCDGCYVKIESTPTPTPATVSTPTACNASVLSPDGTVEYDCFLSCTAPWISSGYNDNPGQTTCQSQTTPKVCCFKTKPGISNPVVHEPPAFGTGYCATTSGGNVKIRPSENTCHSGGVHDSSFDTWCKEYWTNNDLQFFACSPGPAKPISTVAPKPTETPGPTATPTPAPPTEPNGGYCAGSNQANANPQWYIKGGTPTCNFGSAIYISGPDNKDNSYEDYCLSVFGGTLSKFYACPGTTGGTNPGGGSSATIICDGKGGVDGSKYPNGYVAPICSNVDPAPDTWSKFTFDATKAKAQGYKTNKNYDVFLCVNGSYDFAPKPPNGNTDVCNAYPWTQDTAGSTPTPNPEHPCKDPEPYWNGQKCTPKPDACNNTGPHGGINICQTTACASGKGDYGIGATEREANLACSLDTGIQNSFCCAKPLAPGETRAPTQPPTATPAPNTGGSTCSSDGAACGNNSNNACHSGWNTSALACCPFSQRFCGTTGTCTTSQGCPSQAAATPAPTSSCNTHGGLETSRCFRQSDCNCGYSCGSGGYCIANGTPPPSNNIECSGVCYGGCGGTLKCKADNISSSGFACKGGASECTGTQPGAATPTPRPAQPQQPAVAGCPGGPGTDYPNSRCIVPDTFCPTGTHHGNAGNDAACAQQVSSSTPVCCIDNNYHGSTASLSQPISTCTSNVQCVNSKLGNACVFYGKSSIGICKNVQ